MGTQSDGGGIIGDNQLVRAVSVSGRTLEGKDMTTSTTVDPADVVGRGRPIGGQRIRSDEREVRRYRCALHGIVEQPETSPQRTTQVSSAFG